MAWWIPIASAVAGAAVSGAISSNEQRKLRNQAKEDDATRFQRLRASAEVAGFNPLTALRAAGTSTINQVALSRANAFGDVAASIVQGLGQAYVDKYEAKAKQSVVPKITKLPIAKSKAVETTRLEVNVSPKNWAGLNKNVQKQIANAENIEAQGKIDGAVDTVAKFKALGQVFEGSGAFGAMPSYEETLGELGSTVMAPVLATDAVIATARKGARKNMITWPEKTGRTTTTQSNYKIHRDDILLGVLPPLSQVHFIKNGEQVF